MIKTDGYGEEEQADDIRTVSVLPCSGFTIHCLSPSNLHRHLPEDLYNTPPNPFGISVQNRRYNSLSLGVVLHRRVRHAPVSSQAYAKD